MNEPETNIFQNLRDAFRARAEYYHAPERRIFDAPINMSTHRAPSDVFLAFHHQAGPETLGMVAALREEILPYGAVKSSSDLKDVNEYVNEQIEYDLGEDNGTKFKSPKETLTQGAGDCEDYAITKFHALKRLGIPEENMRIVGFSNGENGIGHAALAVRMNNDVYILDNNFIEVLSYNQYMDFMQLGEMAGPGFTPTLSFDSSHGLRILDRDAIQAAQRQRDGADAVPDASVVPSTEAPQAGM